MPFNPAAFKSAASGAGGSEAPPDGDYDAELYATKFITDKHGRRWLLLTWNVLSGRERDRTWESWHTLDEFNKDGEPNQGALAMTIKQLAKLVEVEPDKLPELGINSEEDLERVILEPSTGGEYELKVQRSGIFTNTYVQRKLKIVAPSLPGTGGYGSPPNGGGNAIYAGDVATSQSSTREQTGAMPERTGESDVTKRGDAESFDRSAAPKRGDVDPETGEEIPF